MKTLAFLFSLALAAGCSLPALADDNMGVLSGTVTIKDGAQTMPAAGIKVSAESPAGGAHSATTDRDGHFFMPGLLVGTYTLTFTKPNSGSASYKGVNITAAENRVIGFMLERRTDGMYPHLSVAHRGRTADLYVVRSETPQ